MSISKQRMLSDRVFYTACPKCSNPPGKFRFNSHSIDNVDSLLKDGIDVPCISLSGRGTNHDYSMRDGILLALAQSPYESDDMFWAFTATSERQGLIDLRIGVVQDVTFDEPFEEVYYIKQRSIPNIPEQWNYAFHLAVELLKPTGFKFISSFIQELPQQDEEVSYLIGWNAYGRMEQDESPPIWRRILTNAYKHLLMGVWYLALLESAFALESFFDTLISLELSSRNIPDKYIDHVLCVGERPEELRALRDIRDYPHVSYGQIKKLSNELNQNVFSPRNNLAHGKLSSSEVTQECAHSAIKTVQQSIWDWDIQARQWLLLIERESSIDELREQV